MNDLEKFRRAWQEEVSQRRHATAADTAAQGADEEICPPSEPELPQQTQPSEPATIEARLASAPGQVVEPEFVNAHPALPVASSSSASSIRLLDATEQKALSLFEKAVDREHVGKMMDAVNFYRDAFKLDDRVDRLYREKYFDSVKSSVVQSTAGSGTSSGTQTPRLMAAGVSGAKPSTVVRAQAGTEIKRLVSTEIDKSAALECGKTDMERLADMLVSLTITAEDEEKACPLAQLPLEILEYILCMVAVSDLGSFVRCLRACKIFHHLGTHTKYIWRTLALRDFGAQHYSDAAIEELSGVTPQEGSDNIWVKLDNDLVVQRPPWNGSWRDMYMSRPRLRFDGIYISTCNYLRPGVGESWYTPLLMVTYYRYLRFYKDGRAISLLTTDEPRDVVPVFVRQMPHEARTVNNKDGGYSVQRSDGTLITRPRGIVNGEWEIQDASGNVLIETEGSVDKYTFHLSLNIRSSGSKRQNKLKWAEFWSINKLTGDRAEFTLKNDKAYFFAPYDYVRD